MAESNKKNGSKKHAEKPEEIDAAKVESVSVVDEKEIPEGAEEVTAAEGGVTAVFGDGTVKVFGFGHKLPVKTRPIMVTNDEADRALFFPKAKMAGSLAWSDKLWRIHVVVTAEFIDTANLKTVMPIFSTKEAQYADGSVTAEEIDGEGGSGDGNGA